VSTYGEALAAGRAVLAEAGVRSAAVDARLLMGHASGLDAAALISRGREAVPALAEAAFRSHLNRRMAGEPVDRILGEKEFWGLRLELGPATLAPRPETETLVTAVLARARKEWPADLRICDLGTGSGAIVIALLAELPAARAVATDISAEALRIAGRNAERHGVADRACFEEIGFADGPAGPFEVVVSNPPYICSADIDALDREVRDFDPRAALDGGADGMDACRAILSRAPALLEAGGLMALEVGHDQAEAVGRLCRAHGMVDLSFENDLGGTARVVMATMPSVPGVRRWASKKSLGNIGVSG
jgi:release factor glutamine methyltransferase